jgi:hypothetical protein
MSNPRFSLNDTAVMLKHVRVATDARDMVNGLTVSRAFTIAERTLEKLFQERHPGPPPAKPREENVPPRVPCTTHREKSFKFSDGTVIRACSHDECGWGRTRKTHTNGMASGTLHAIEFSDAGEVDEEVESSPDDPTELSMDTMPMQAHVDEGEVGIVPELTWEDEVVEEANSEKADDEVMLECE